jgi:hypothetical protein
MVGDIDKSQRKYLLFALASNVNYVIRRREICRYIAEVGQEAVHQELY